LVFFHLFISPTVYAYQLKAVVVPGYSKPWIMLHSDQSSVHEINQIRIHFHGWTQDPRTGKPYQPKIDFEWKDPKLPPSEIDMRKLIEGYSIQKEVESNDRLAIIIPLSRGHCDQYPELLTNFDSIFSNVLRAFDLNAALLHASAHSGGGQFLSHLLASASRSIFLSQTLKLSLFDAIYGDSTLMNLQKWLDETKGGEVAQLQLLSISHQKPSLLADKFFTKISALENLRNYKFNGILINTKSKKLENGNQISLIEEGVIPNTLNHWTLLQQLWSF